MRPVGRSLESPDIEGRCIQTIPENGIKKKLKKQTNKQTNKQTKKQKQKTLK